MKHLTRAVKLGYGVGDLGGNLFFTLGGFYLLFYLTDVVGMAAGLAGTALMIGKVWDAVTDPLAGYLSDRTRSRFGRRRPWLFVGAFVMIAGMFVMFRKPEALAAAGGGALFAYVVLAACFVNTGYTLINIPYGAMTPDLTPDFDERTELNGYRMSFAVVGTFVGAGAVLPLVALFGGGAAGWTGMALVTGVIIAVATLIVVFTVHEKQHTGEQPKRGIIGSYLEVLKLRPFLLVLIPWAFHIAGINIIQAALLYYFRAIYGNEAAFQIALPILLGAAIVFIPVWVRISKSIGKRASYNTGMLIFAASVIVFFLFGHRGGPQFAFVVMGIAGVGFATQYVMPFSILPDVVEYDYAEHGVRREGVFYGTWTFMSKIGQAVGVGINGWILTAFGYREAVGGVVVEQPESALIGIRLLVGPIPAACFLIGVLVLHFYPITREVYEEIQQRAAERAAEQRRD